MSQIAGQRIHFVTGKLAADALRQIVEQLAAELSFRPSIEVLPISVAALMTTDWIAKKWAPPTDVDRVVLPGYCAGELAELQNTISAPCEKGPRDLRGLAKFLGGHPPPSDYGRHNIEIIAEINHAPRLSGTNWLPKR